MMMYGTLYPPVMTSRMRSPTSYEGDGLLFLLSLWFFNDSLQIPAEDGAKEGGGVE